MLRSYGLCSSPHAVQLHWCCLAGGVSCSCRDRQGWTLPEAKGSKAVDWVAACGQSAALSSELRQFMSQEQHLVDGFMYECSQRRWQDLPSHLVALMRLMMSFSLRKRILLKLLRQLQLTCFRMIFWTTSEVHCGSVVFPTDVFFVECCPGQPYEPCLVPEGQSGEALIQSSRSGSIGQHISELVCGDAAWTVQLFCTCNSGPLNRPPTPGLSRLAGWSNPIAVCSL